jgi:hypothetical protein
MTEERVSTGPLLSSGNPHIYRHGGTVMPVHESDVKPKSQQAQKEANPVLETTQAEVDAKEAIKTEEWAQNLMNEAREDNLPPDGGVRIDRALYEGTAVKDRAALAAGSLFDRTGKEVDPAKVKVTLNDKGDYIVTA